MHKLLLFAAILPMTLHGVAPNLSAQGETQEQIQVTAPSLNGFSLTDLRIPLDQIQSGGPPRDGIPSIDKPIFTHAETADYSNDEHVLALYFNGIAKAYAIRILDWHEIVNDRFEDQKVTITYCPLCNSGTGFLAGINGTDRNFGVSGLLYNSDVLMFDRESESLWSQIMGESVSGPESGVRLELLPVQTITWGAWREQYPNTLALTEETGYSRNYSGTAYGSYRNSDQLMFDVEFSDPQMSNKELVIGIEVDGKAKCYPFNVLKKSKGVISDSIGSRPVLVYYDKQGNYAYITNNSGDLLPSITLYWFAWYTFHTDTEVYVNH